MPTVSIIIPVYNTEQYLHRCIDSILGQTFTDFELLLVDDGSKDNSGAICDEYAARDSRIRVFHKPNGGVSSARNVGLDNARGEWVTFCDSDDYVDKEYLSVLRSAHDQDLVIVNYIQHTATERHIPPCADLLINENALYNFLVQGIGIYLLRSTWGKLFKLNIIDSLGLRFNEVLRAFEDTIFVLKYCMPCKSIEMINLPCYNYMFNDDNKESSLSRNRNIYINQYSVMFSELWILNEQLKSLTGTTDNLLFRIYIDWIFFTTLSAILHTHSYSLLKEFASDLNVKRYMNELKLKASYRRKRTLTLRLIKNGKYRLALFSNLIPPKI